MKEQCNRRKPCIEGLESRTLMSHALANLSFAVTGPASVVAGTDATYQLTVTNSGPAKASPISFTPALPSGVTQVSLTQTSGPVTALPVGQSDLFSMTVAVGSGVANAKVLNVSTTLNCLNNSNTAGDVQSVMTTVTVSADVSLVITGPSEVLPGQTATFALDSFNSGPSDATTLLDTVLQGLPDGAQLTSLNYISGPGAPLPAGSFDSYGLQFSVPANVANGTALSFPVHTNGGTTDPVPTNNDATLTTKVTTANALPANVALSSSDLTITQGNAVTYSVAVAPVTAGTATPTGTVTFTSDGKSFGSVPLQSDGAASFSAAALPAGNHLIIASYSGDSTYIPTTAGVFQVVKPVLPSLVLPSFGKLNLPAQVVAGNKIKASLPVNFINNGPLLLGTYTVTLFTDTGATFDGNQVQIGSLSKNITLKAGAHAGFVFNLKSLPASLPDGTYYVLAQITDPILRTNLVSTAQTVTVAAPFIQLNAAAAAVLPASIKINKSGSLTVSITNNGNIDALGPLNITLAPSTDGVSPIAGVTLATLITKKTTIKAGKTAKFVLHIKHTSAQPPAIYFPIVTISLAGQNAIAVGATQFSLL
jgi:uncharacterized repeat protein (TIGR01451 family)